MLVTTCAVCITKRMHAGCKTDPPIPCRASTHALQVNELPPLKKRVDALTSDLDQCRKSDDEARHALDVTRQHLEQVGPGAGPPLQAAVGGKQTAVIDPLFVAGGEGLTLLNVDRYNACHVSHLPYPAA